MISAVQFDPSGDFLASGDRAGRVVMFERNQSVLVDAFPIFHLFVEVLL
jgi:hypothetical protein